MAGQLTETEINIRKQTLESDLSTVKEQLNGGNDKDVTSSIPSASKKKKGANDVAAAVMS